MALRGWWLRARLQLSRSGGTSESDLDWRPIDAALGQGTMRTMGTVEQIAAKYR